jgi:hypothetical protein
MLPAALYFGSSAPPLRSAVSFGGVRREKRKRREREEKRRRREGA